MTPQVQTTTLYLITGFLGAGKTTFLRDRLMGGHGRTGVLVNDFGKINFDGLQIRREGLSMLELSNGSIFCSCLKDDFISGLVSLIRAGLDEIYIESSGLADPSDMDRILQLVRRQTGGTPFRYGGSICLIDARHFLRTLPRMLSAERQVKHSHVVLINKCDLAEPEQIAEIRAILHELNPQAVLVETTFAKTGWPILPDLLPEIPAEETTNTVETRNKNLILHLTQTPELKQLMEFLRSIGSHFYRVKGFVEINDELQLVNQVNDQISIEPAQIMTTIPEGNQLVCLTSQGIASISHLAMMAEKHLKGKYRIEM